MVQVCHALRPEPPSLGVPAGRSRPSGLVRAEANLKTGRMTFAARHISIAINRPFGEVYDFAGNPENLPKWAAGLSSSIGMVDDDWVAETAAGPVRVKFAERNEFGVLDHYVITASGESIYNPLRVLGNGDGARGGVPRSSDAKAWMSTKLRRRCGRGGPGPAHAQATARGLSRPTVVGFFPAGVGKRTYTESAGSDVRYALPRPSCTSTKFRNSLFGRRNDNRFTACRSRPRFPRKCA